MQIEHLVSFTSALLLLSLLAEPVARWVRLPHASVLVVFGAIGAYITTQLLGWDLGLRAQSFHDLIFFVFLPILIFEAAYKISLSKLLPNVGVVLFLAVVGTILTTLFSGTLLYYGIGHATGFPWIAALLAGALLAATDPAAVIAQLKQVGAPERLGILLEGESLFNDATAIVVFSLFLTLALMPESNVTLGFAGLEFARIFFGGVAIGGITGLIAVRLLRKMTDPILVSALTLVAAYGSYLAAELVAHVSGVMAILIAGLLVAREQAVLDQVAKRRTGHLWSTLGYVANGAVFLLVGVTITVSMFTERWLAMLIAIGAMFVARALVTYVGLGVANLALKDKVSAAYQTVIVWGGLRGAVTLALALALPVSLDYWFTIQSMAFGVVLFTLFVQAPTMPWLLRRTKLVQNPPNTQ